MLAYLEDYAKILTYQKLWTFRLLAKEHLTYFPIHLTSSFKPLTYLKCLT